MKVVRSNEGSIDRGLNVRLRNRLVISHGPVKISILIAWGNFIMRFVDKEVSSAVS